CDHRRSSRCDADRRRTAGARLVTESFEPFEPRRVPKPWGEELIWALTDRYCGKVITIETGRRLSLQYHEQKDEAILVTSGRLRLHIEDDAGSMTTREMGPGESARVAVGRRHRFEAIERVEPIEG